MNKSQSIKSVIGLTQEEAAMLFKVNKSQVGMFVIGKRSLPTEAMLQFTNMLQHLQEDDQNAAAVKDIFIAEQKNKVEWLQREQMRLQIQQTKTEQQITAMEAKRADCFIALKAISFLEKQKNENIQLLESIKTRVRFTLKKNSLQYLEELHLKKDQTEFLRNRIAEKLKQR